MKRKTTLYEHWYGVSCLIFNCFPLGYFSFILMMQKGVCLHVIHGYVSEFNRALSHSLTNHSQESPWEVAVMYFFSFTQFSSYWNLKCFGAVLYPCLWLGVLVSEIRLEVLFLIEAIISGSRSSLNLSVLRGEVWMKSLRVWDYTYFFLIEWWKFFLYVLDRTIFADFRKGWSALCDDV